MSGKRAKIIRQIVYGDLYAGRKLGERKYARLPNGQIIVIGNKRYPYQKAKKHREKSYSVSLRMIHAHSRLSIKPL